ncbi:unnamed protein product, partial [Chrysoparadoxa australica]
VKNHKFQLIRIGVPSSGAAVRFNGETDKGYERVSGIFVSVPDPRTELGASMSLKIGGIDVFDEEHDIRLLTCGNGVAPNDKFFKFEENLEGAGSGFEGRFTDISIEGVSYPYEAKVFLWLTNNQDPA